jgi:rod shape-determining protein MreB
VKKSHPELAFSDRMATEAKEKYADVSANGAKAIVKWPVNGKPTEVDLTKEMREACLSIVPPMVESLHKLIADFDPEFQTVLRNNVLLGGGGSQIKGLGDALADYMDKHLGGGKVMTVEEPVYAGANGALKIARDMPKEYWEQLT